LFSRDFVATYEKACSKDVMQSDWKWSQIPGSRSNGDHPQNLIWWFLSKGLFFREFTKQNLFTTFRAILPKQPTNRGKR